MSHWHCRCAECQEWRRTYYRARRRRLASQPGAPPRSLVDSTGTRRRAEAMCCLGYSLREQARLTGHAIYAYRAVLKTSTVRKSTAIEVAAVYAKLWDKPAPPDAHSMRTIKMAHERGYRPPLAWDDDTIDDPNAQPQDKIRAPVKAVDELAVSIVVNERRPMRLHGVDLVEANRRLRALGLSEDAIRDLTHGPTS